MRYGYESPSFPVYFSQQPLLSVMPKDTTSSTDDVDPSIDAPREKVKAKLILKFHERADSLFVSGLVGGPVRARSKRYRELESSGQCRP